MLPENDPNRIIATRDLRCFDCSIVLPVGVSCYALAHTAFCGGCYAKRQEARAMYAAESNPPRNAADDEIEWPEDMFENIVVDPIKL